MTDKEKLRDFIESLVKVLDSVVNARDVLFPARMRDTLESAWMDLRLGGAIDNIYPAIDSADERRLINAGLAGNQLELKYGGFRTAYRRFIRRGGLKLLKDLLDWANVVLPSLTSVINISEPLKELKDAIEKALEHAGA